MTRRLRRPNQPLMNNLLQQKEEALERIGKKRGQINAQFVAEQQFAAISMCPAAWVCIRKGKIFFFIHTIFRLSFILPSFRTLPTAISLHEEAQLPTGSRSPE